MSRWPNFGVERYKLVEYGECTGDSGCYWADLDAQYKRAEAELAKEIAAKKPGEKLAIVMDIDETTLTNYCEMRREDFGYIGPMYRPVGDEPGGGDSDPGRAAAVQQGARGGRGGVLHHRTRRESRTRCVQYIGVGDETRATAKNLEAAGFHGWAGLRLRNGEENHMPTIAYKSAGAAADCGRWLPHRPEPGRPVERSAGRPAGGYEREAAESVLFHSVAALGDESGGRVRVSKDSMGLLERAKRQGGRVFESGADDVLGGFGLVFKVLPLYFKNKAEREPKVPLGPFRTDVRVFRNARRRAGCG